MTRFLWPYTWICLVHFKGLKIKTLIELTSLHSRKGRAGSFLSIVSAYGTDEKIFEVPRRNQFPIQNILAKDNKNNKQRSSQIQVAKRKAETKNQFQNERRSQRSKEDDSEQVE